LVNRWSWVEEKTHVVLNEELKRLLVCPKCRGDLEFREDLSTIRCMSCRLSYPIVDDIPVLLVDQAKPLSEGAARPEGG
jgi:uncharacterized protein YbaR (Trm112 family)